MEFSKRFVLLIAKVVAVLLIPYYLIVDSTSGFNSSTHIIFAGTWGVSYGSFEIMGPIPFWAQNQLVFSLLFILPMIAFSHFYGERTLDRKCVTAAAISVALSYSITYLSTTALGVNLFLTSPTIILPSIVSLSIFVFVFWPLLKNSWTALHRSYTIQEEQGILSKLHKVLRETVPINTATLMWVSLVIFPANLMYSSGGIPEVNNSMYLFVSGGLPIVSYQYSYIGGVIGNPYIQNYFLFNIASAVSPVGLIMWIFSLLLGITTLQFILGKSTIKRVRVLAIVAILAYTIPSLVILVSSLLFGMGALAIPLPLYPITMLLVAKFIHAPVQKEQPSEEMIRVPLGTRISSILSRRRHNREGPHLKKIEDEEISDQ